MSEKNKKVLKKRDLLQLIWKSEKHEEKVEEKEIIKKKMERM